MAVFVAAWSGADWSIAEPLLAAGLMPCLAGMVRDGSRGVLRGFAPFDPALSWITAATGTHPDDHLAGPPAMWQTLAEAGKRCAVVGWAGAKDVMSAAGAAAAAGVRVRPEELDFKLLGLFVPRLAEIDPALDPRPGRLVQALAELYTTHNAAVVAARVDAPELLAVGYRFLDRVTAEFLPFHGTADSPYGAVVGGAYRLMDGLLADLPRRLGRDAAVIVLSDHGFLKGVGGVARRAYGMVAARGLGGVAAGTELVGAQLADLAPTVLAEFGVRAGEWVRGRAWGESRIPALARSEQAYSESPLHLSEPLRRSASEALAVGTALAELGRAPDAVPWLQRCQLAEPESVEAGWQLAQCLIRLGLLDEAGQAAGAVFDLGEEHPRALLLRAQLAIERRRGADAWSLLQRLPPGAFLGERGPIERRALLQTNRFAEAGAAFAAALRLEPEEPLLHVGLGHARLWLGDLPGARESAQEALRREAAQPDALDLLRQIQAARAGDQPAAGAAAPASWESLRERAAVRAPVRAGLRERAGLAAAARQRLRGAAKPLRFIMHAPAPSQADRTVVVVTGRPAAGTSLLLRILGRSGLPVLSDGVRRPDAENPAGYLEWAPIAELARNPRAIAAAAGKAVMVPAESLAHLPRDRDYRVICLRDGGEPDPKPIRFSHWLNVEYRALLAEPAAVVAEIIELVGADRIKRPLAFLGVISEGVAR